MAFATVNDLIARWRPLSADEIEKAKILLEDCTNALILYGEDRGLDLVDMCDKSKARASVAEAIVCDIVKREMVSMVDESPAMSQVSQSAGGYSVSGTFLSPGGGLFIKNYELKMLGLAKQKVKMEGRYDCTY